MSLEGKKKLERNNGIQENKRNKERPRIKARVMKKKKERKT